jgi:DGQHR domain-containing protein
MNKTNPDTFLELPALEVRQGPNRRLYLFAVDGKRLDEFATVSRVHRDHEAQVHGYQRPEVVSHITEIRRYLESTDPLVPNALVIAFDHTVKFTPYSTHDDDAYSVAGIIRIPIDPTLADKDKAGWIVDGQQRTAAIREARIDSFPVSVVGFIASDAEEQRAQFILVNATKPLPKSLIYELLPSTSGSLPTHLVKKRLPTRLLERMNFDADSPLRGMIQTPTTPTGVIKDNSILRALDNSISDGALYWWRDPQTGKGDIESMLALLRSFWTAVELVFPDAWGLPTRRSRLMHGAGIISLSFVMDAIAEPLLEQRTPNVADFVRGLRVIEPICHWTEGTWDFGEGVQRRWNEIQNTPKDVQTLTSYLLFEYRRRSGRLL